MNAVYEIIEAGKDKLRELQSICITTFAETYEHLNTPENFKDYVERHFNLEQLKSELENKNSFTYFLLAENAVVGYLKLNVANAQTEVMPAEALEIERIYVLKSQQRKGFGEALFQVAIAKAKQLGKKFVWLGVWEKNEKAIAFYEKNRFTKFGTHIFKLGDDDQTDFLYKFTLE